MILVVGATGNLGGLITQRLMQGGWELRVLLRKPSEALGDMRIHPVFGDLKDAASLELVCDGVDTLIATASAGQRSGEDSIASVDLRGYRHLVDTARKCGVKHFIYISAQFAHPTSPIPLLAAKAYTEKYLQRSGIPFTILAPNAYMDCWITHMVTLPIFQNRPIIFAGTGSRRHAMIAMQDVVEFVLATLDNPITRNRRLVLNGPQALSIRDVVAIFERILGREMEVQGIPLDQPIPGLPIMISQLASHLDLFDTAMHISETAPSFAIPPTSAEAFIRRQLACELIPSKFEKEKIK